jgi:hypothetical protein
MINCSFGSSLVTDMLVNALDKLEWYRGILILYARVYKSSKLNGPSSSLVEGIDYHIEKDT